MLRSLLAGLVLPLLFSGFQASAQTWRWATRGGSAADDWIEAAATDAAGNIYVIGSFSGQINLDGTVLTSTGGTDVFVARLLPMGIWDWAVRLGGRGNDYAGDIAVAGGNVYVSGAFSDTAAYGTNRRLISNGSQDAFVGRLAAGTGVWGWAVGAGGSGPDEGAGLAVVAAGTVYLTGQFGSPNIRFATVANLTNAAVGTSDGFLARLASNNGTWQGAIRAGGTGNDVLGRVAVDARGGIVVLGAFDSPTLPLSASLSLTNAGSTDAFVGKLGSSAVAWQWAARVGGAGDDVARDLVLDASNNAYVTGSFGSDSVRFGSTRLVNAGADSTADVFVAKINTTGAWQWVTRGGSPHHETAHALLADGSDLLITGELGGFFETGRSRVTNSGPLSTTDLYLARITNAGTWVDVARAGGAGNESPNALTKGATSFAAGSVAVLGSFSSPRLTFGGVTLNNAAPTGGASDFFAALFDATTLTATEAVVSEEAAFALWPNPAHGAVRLSGLPAGATAVQVLDAVGRVVRAEAIAPGAAALELDLTTIPGGVYFVRAGGQLRRLVVE